MLLACNVQSSQCNAPISTTAPLFTKFTTGIYQPETFKRESKYGLTVLTTTDTGLLSYLSSVMSQMSTWLTEGEVQRLVVVVSGIDSGETLERWQFNVDVDDNCGGSSSGVGVQKDENVSQNVVKSGGGNGEGKKKEKTVKEVHDEIQAIIRQITASVSGSVVGFNCLCCIGLTNNVYCSSIN